MPGFPATSIQLRYSKAKFKTTLLTALLLTVMVTGVTYMVLTSQHVRNANLWTAITALIFFGFCSAQMMWRFYNRDVILAVRPTGLFDARISTEMLPWDAVKEVVVRQREQDFQLEVFLWPRQQGEAPPGKPISHAIDLEPFDVSLVAITDAINEHVPVRLD